MESSSLHFNSHLKFNDPIKKRLVGALDNSEIQNLKDRVRGIDCVPRIANSMFSRV